MKELLSINDFCQVTNLGRTRTYQLLKQGIVKAVKVGRRTFIRRQDAQLWIANLTDYPTRNSSEQENNHDAS